jgi:hypothetical protein
LICRTGFRTHFRLQFTNFRVCIEKFADTSQSEWERSATKIFWYNEGRISWRG